MTTRNLRRKNITIAPNLLPVYAAVCDYYNIPHHDASTVFNICLHSVGQALANKLNEESKEVASELPKS